MKSMRWHPPGYGGDRLDPDRVKRDGWHEQRMLAVSLDDPRLTWPERELVRQLGEKLYGKRSPGQGARHD
jgi:hypothetical protein